MQSYVAPATSHRLPMPFGRLVFTARDGALIRIQVQTGLLDAPDSAPEAVARWMRLAEDAVASGALLGQTDFSDLCTQPGWTKLTGFARTVLTITSRLPAGTIISYGELAEQAGNPNAHRAVARVLAANPYPVLIPCHRVASSEVIAGMQAGRPETFMGKAFCGREDLRAVAAWLRINDLGLI